MSVQTWLWNTEERNKKPGDEERFEGREGRLQKKKVGDKSRGDEGTVLCDLRDWLRFICVWNRSTDRWPKSGRKANHICGGIEHLCSWHLTHLVDDEVTSHLEIKKRHSLRLSLQAVCLHRSLPDSVAPRQLIPEIFKMAARIVGGGPLRHLV